MQFSISCFPATTEALLRWENKASFDCWLSCDISVKKCQNRLLYVHLIVSQRRNTFPGHSVPTAAAAKNLKHEILHKSQSKIHRNKSQRNQKTNQQARRCEWLRDWETYSSVNTSVSSRLKKSSSLCVQWMNSSILCKRKRKDRVFTQRYLYYA